MQNTQGDLKGCKTESMRTQLGQIAAARTKQHEDRQQIYQVYGQ